MENQIGELGLVPEAGQTDPNQPNAGSNPPVVQGQGGTGGEVNTNPPEPAQTISVEQYNNLRREFTKKSMELADIKKGRVGITQPQEQPTGYAPPQPNPYKSQFANIGDYIDSRVNEVLEPLEQQQRELTIQTKIKSLADQYDDFDDVADDFVGIIEDSPELLDVDGGLELAFLAARSLYLEDNAQAIAIAEMQAKQETEAQKQGLGGATGMARQQIGGAQMTEEEAVVASIMGNTKKSIFGF